MVENPKPTEVLQRHIRIGLLGPLGSGKSTLSGMLGERWNVKPLIEDYENNPYLEKFYDNPKEFSFKSQIWFLERKIAQLSEPCSLCTEIIDPSYEMDKLYAMTHHKIGWMNDHEWKLYQELFEVLTTHKQIKTPDFNVVIRADKDVLVKRIKHRIQTESRFFEAWMLEKFPEYLDHLTDSVDEWTNRNVFVIDTGYYDLNLPENEKELSRIEGHVALFILNNGNKLHPPQFAKVGSNNDDRVGYSDGIKLT
jgi:deoxyadenosine/deoxycytidine kinase